MNILESVVALFFLALVPLLLVAWLFGALGRREMGIGRLPEAFGRIVSAAKTLDLAVQSVQSSFVHQIGAVTSITAHAIGYMPARLQGETPDSIVRTTVGEDVVLVIRLNDHYTFSIGYSRKRPEHYRGAKVDLREPTEPVSLELTAHCPGLAIHENATRGNLTKVVAADEWSNSLLIEPGREQMLSLQLEPKSRGPTTLKVEVFRDEEWIQSLSLKLDVRTAAEMGRLPRLRNRVTAESEQVAKFDCIETAATLPVASEPSERRLHLECRASETGSFNLKARTHGHSRRLRVTLTKDDLADINDMLREGLDDLRGYFGGTDSQEPDVQETRNKLLASLAKRGRAALNRIFTDQGDRDFLRVAMGEAAALGDKSDNIEVSTDHFFLPWEMLYDAPPDQDFAFEGFWGCRFNISRMLSTISERPSPVIVVNRVPRVAVFANTELEHVREEEMPYLYGLAEQDKIELDDWSHYFALAPPSEDPLNPFVAFCRGHKSDLAHFACHAVADLKRKLDSYIELSPDLRISLLDMYGRNHMLAGAPLVLLNACGTSIRDPRRTSDFVHRFMLSGGRGVLATECDVPDDFASLFIQRVYQDLLAGTTLGQATLAARRHFLKTKGNPLGLLYAVYAPLEARLYLGDGTKDQPDASPVL